MELQAERRAPASFEDNWLLDKDRELESADCLLRLRIDGRGAALTFKGPAHFEGRMKLREEHETAVDNPEAARTLLERLGFNAVRRYQKVREEWQIGGVTIALDHTPIGDFAEFEGEGADTVARRCGFDLDKAERRTYMRLYDEYFREHPEAPPDMVFPEEAPR